MVKITTPMPAAAPAPAAPVPAVAPVDAATPEGMTAASAATPAAPAAVPAAVSPATEAQPDITAGLQEQVQKGKEAQARIEALQAEVPPTDPHARLYAMIQGIGAALSGAGKAIATRGKEGGAEETARILGEEQQQRMREQQMWMEQRNQKIQNQITLLQTAHVISQDYMLLAQAPDIAKKTHFEAEEAAVHATTAASEFAEQHYQLTPEQYAGAAPLSAADLARVRKGVGLTVGNASSLIPNDPAVKSAQGVLANPQADAKDILQAESEVKMAVGVKQQSMVFEKAQADLTTAQAAAAAAPADIAARRDLEKAQTTAWDAEAELHRAQATQYLQDTTPGVFGDKTVNPINPDLPFTPQMRDKAWSTFNEKVLTPLETTTDKSYKMALQTYTDYQKAGGRLPTGAQSMMMLSQHLTTTFGNVKGARVTKDMIHEHLGARSVSDDALVAIQKLTTGDVLSPGQWTAFMSLVGESRADAYKAAIDNARANGIGKSIPGWLPQAPATGTKIDASDAEIYMYAAHGDPVLARKAATNAGWSF